MPFADIPNQNFGFETLLVYSLALVCSSLLIFFLSDPPRARQRATIITVALCMYCVAMAALRPPVYKVRDIGATTNETHTFASALDLRHSVLFNAQNLTPRYRTYYLLLRLPNWIALTVVAGWSSAVFLQAGRRARAAPVIAEALRPEMIREPF